MSNEECKRALLENKYVAFGCTNFKLNVVNSKRVLQNWDYFIHERPNYLSFKGLSFQEYISLKTATLNTY
jgi:hypothetical protein